MTITNRTLNARLMNLERCAEEAPEGTYEEAKKIVRVIGAISTATLLAAREAGLPANNADTLRNFEVSIFEYFLAGAGGTAPDHTFSDTLAAAEGFGDAMSSPAAGRVKAQAIRDRDAIARLRAEA